MDQAFLEDARRESGDNLSRLARRLGVNYHGVVERFRKPSRPFVAPRGALPTNPASVAKPGMERFAIAVKAAGCHWPTIYFNALQRARALYDAGTHEMMQETRADGWVVQYLVPRLITADRKPYFARRDV